MLKHAFRESHDCSYNSVFSDRLHCYRTEGRAGTVHKAEAAKRLVGQKILAHQRSISWQGRKHSSPPEPKGLRGRMAQVGNKSAEACRWGWSPQPTSASSHVTVSPFIYPSNVSANAKHLSTFPSIWRGLEILFYIFKCLISCSRPNSEAAKLFCDKCRRSQL